VTQMPSTVMTRRALLRNGIVLGSSAVVALLVEACAPRGAPSATPTTASPAGASATSAPPPAGSPTSAAAPSAQGASSTEKVTLSIVWRTSAGEEKVMKRLWSEFQQQHSNVTIEAQFATGCDVDKKVELLVAGGTPPALWSSIACQGVRYWVARDKTVVLDDYVKRDQYDLSDFYDSVMPLCRWQGKLVALPVLQAPTLLVYNQDIFEAAGVPFPPKDWNDTSWNWDRWLEQAVKLTKQDASGRTTQYAMGSWGDLRYSALRIFGTDWFDLQTIIDTGYPSKFFPDRDVAIAALQFEHDAMYKHKVVPLPGQVQALQAGAPNLFQTGKIAMQQDLNFALLSNAPVKAFKWSVAAIPAPVKLKRFNFMYPDQYTIIKPQKYQDWAWELLKFMTSPHGYQGYPIEANGGISPRKSLAEYWMTTVQQLSGKTKEELQVAVDGMSFQQTAWGHPCIVPELWPQGIQPSLDKLFANEIDAKTAVDQIEAACKRVLAQAKGQ
jgi:multiple sugar transport system substrate-binding protein